MCAARVGLVVGLVCYHFRVFHIDPRENLCRVTRILVTGARILVADAPFLFTEARILVTAARILVAVARIHFVGV
jgi:hypothetical protein